MDEETYFFTLLVYHLHITLLSTSLSHSLHDCTVGGMQTEGVSGISRFKNDTTFIQPNIGVRPEGTSTWRASAESKKIKSDIDLRIKNLFLTLKA